MGQLAGHGGTCDTEVSLVLPELLGGPSPPLTRNPNIWETENYAEFKGSLCKKQKD